VIIGLRQECELAEPQIRFEDGAGYERMMGKWSQLAGSVFLDWLRPPPGLGWVDVGCGNGAFTQLIVDQCAPSEVHGIDPSEGQLSFARARSAARLARFQIGDAMSLPFDDHSFDVAVMALVIFFVPDPAVCVQQMVRVVRPGGIVAAYAWDVLGGGFPLETMQSAMRAMGIAPLLPPSVEASRVESMQSLWARAGMQDIETRQIRVQRTFDDFDDYWTTSLLGSSIRSKLAAMGSNDVEQLKARLRAELPADGDGRITSSGFANAIKGHVPN
jgi:ubiquinone/menaquinone biosynthesis C-methylase UbiE